MMNGKSVKKLYAESSDYQFMQPELKLGPWTSYSLIKYPKHISFVLSRQKFCAKMLEGKNTALEARIGDGFGLPIISQSAGYVVCGRLDTRLQEGSARRVTHLTNVTYLNVDLKESTLSISIDAAFMIDVIQHVDPSNEITFIENIVRCLRPNGVQIVGTPNINTSQLATPCSEISHINLKSMVTLRELLEPYFVNVFMFDMNDEVLHTGHPAMCHYLWSIGCGVRQA